MQTMQTMQTMQSLLHALGILTEPANGGKTCGETSLLVNCSRELREEK